MSQQSKIKREKYAKEQEKKGKKVVESIFWLLVLGGAAFAIWTTRQIQARRLEVVSKCLKQKTTRQPCCSICKIRRNSTTSTTLWWTNS